MQAGQNLHSCAKGSQGSTKLSSFFARQCVNRPVFHAVRPYLADIDPFVRSPAVWWLTLCFGERRSCTSPARAKKEKRVLEKILFVLVESEFFCEDQHVVWANAWASRADEEIARGDNGTFSGPTPRASSFRESSGNS